MNSAIHGSNLRDPIRYLGFVHRRMHEEIGKLSYYVQWKQGAQFTEPEEMDVRGTLNYLHKMVRLHADDECGSVFPRIMGTGDPQAESAAPMLRAIEREQLDFVGRFEQVETLYEKWLTQSSLTFQDVWELRTQLKALGLAHRRHIRIEEDRVFPLADKVLCATCRSGIVHEMFERRGLEESATL